jgi:hypothetical protein
MCAALLGLTGPAFASTDPPWGVPKCQTFKPNYERDKLGLPFAPPESREIRQPYAYDRGVYGGIYQAVEQHYAPFAPYFWQELSFEEHRDFVRIRRIAKGGGKPPDYVKAFGSLRFVHDQLRISMRIDKCDGSISELRWHKGKGK